MAQAFDWKASRLLGEPVQIAERVAAAEQTAAWAAVFSAVPGALAYISGTAAPTTLTWLDRKGNRLGSVGEPGEYYSPQLSPDERTLAVGRYVPATDTRDIWLFDLARGGAPSRFTFDPADDMNPAWSPDGARILFSSARRGQRDIYEKAAGGTGEERLLFSSDAEENMEYVSPDGRLGIFNAISPGGKQQVWALPLGGGGTGESKPFLLLSGPADIQSAPFSPDGRFIAYMSSETGAYEIFVQALASGKRWPISTGGGTNPQWRADGKELFYIDAYSKLMAVDIRIAGEGLEAGIPRVLFEAPFWRSGRNVVVPSRDGRRFLAVLQAEQPASRAITVELNWMSRLKPPPSR
jgi:Tol biopolymer transport system component